MKALVSTLALLVFGSCAWAQIKPATEKDIQQCIAKNASSYTELKPTFSISGWLNQIIENADKLKEADGKRNGKQLIALLESEKALDDLIELSGNCPSLAAVRTDLNELKKNFTESRPPQQNKDLAEQAKAGGKVDFEEDKGLPNVSRGLAKKIKDRAEKIRKALR